VVKFSTRSFETTEPYGKCAREGDRGAGTTGSRRFVRFEVSRILETRKCALELGVEVLNPFGKLRAAWNLDVLKRPDGGKRWNVGNVQSDFADSNLGTFGTAFK
jgi:hypothetical protein